MPETLFLLHYTYPPDILERRAPHRESHLTLLREWHDRGLLLYGGAVGHPPTGGLLVFRVPDAETVEHFVHLDPYNAAGLIVSHRVEPWSVAVP